MSVVVREVKGKKLLKIFIHLPAAIHRSHPNWLPPIYHDERVFFNPLKNKAFTHCDTLMLLAFRDGEAAGRILGIIPRDYNRLSGELCGRFGFLESSDDQEVVHSLLEAAENWARMKGMTRMVGPYGFSDKDPQGLMIEGFEHHPVIAAPCNEPYLVDRVCGEGYTKSFDCLMFRYSFSQELPSLYSRIGERVESQNGYRLIEPTSKREVRPLVIPVLRMVNESYTGIYGFLPLDESEMKELAKRYMPVIDPRFVKIVTRGDTIVAFVIGLPNLTKGIQRSRGYLFPFGLFHILYSARKTRQLDLMLGGILPAYQGRGLEVLMGLKLLQSARKAGFTQMEVHLVLESNRKMIAEMERLGAEPHKRFRVFEKPL